MISVITATYNQAAFLEGAVRSLRGQDFPDWEHIIIDDGSTDDTPKILDRLAGQGGDAAKLRVFRTANRGQPAALNFALAQARGEQVAFLDSDDEYGPRHLSLLLETLGERDFALGRYILVNCSGDPRPRIADFYHPGREIDLAEVESGTGLLFGKREVFLRVGGFRPVRFSDTDLFNRLKAAGCSWSRAAEPSYRYFFGRMPDNMAARESREACNLGGAVAEPQAGMPLEGSRMNLEDLQASLAFIREAERLKSVLRTAFTSTGRQESTAEHTWRLCLMAMVFQTEFADIDFDRLLKICVVHDLGEAIHGDIPAIEQDDRPDKAERERADLITLIEPLPPAIRAEFLTLWDEYDQAATPEARLAKGLDKIETILQHNQGRNPDTFDYGFNLAYGQKHMQAHPLFPAIRELIDRDTERLARANT